MRSEVSSRTVESNEEVKVATSSEFGKEISFRWSHWLLPSIADVMFLVLLYFLLFNPRGCSLLNDADTGWHIRNGEQILATHVVPHVDSFSYTKSGQPWFAWEWLYDVIIAGVHHVSGLNGVVLFTAIIISLSFTLLFLFISRRSGSLIIAAALTMLAVNASLIHTLARPHVVSWLFTVLWIEILYRFEEGNRSALLWLPVSMLLWVNIHGGFLLGIVLLAIVTFGHIVRYLPSPCSENRAKILQLACVLFVCSSITLLNPYGYKLYGHLYQYLGDKFLMNSITEFMSPNFHAPGYGYFEFFILLAAIAVLFRYGQITATNLLLILFAIHIGLYAARNIPISVIVLSMVFGPLVATVVSPRYSAHLQSRWVASVVDSIHEISGNLASIESSFRGHILVITIVIAVWGLALNGGLFRSKQVLSFHFDENTFPVRATEFVAKRGIKDHLFSTDTWSGYLIYRLYPKTKVYFDDRHDFYGESFIREYLKAVDGTWQWREPLDKYQISWILIPSNSSLSTILKESNDWHVEYDDGIAIVFSR